ncbi:MAG: hypothetical protein WAO81_13655, partial [Methanosarcina flavescens]
LLKKGLSENSKLLNLRTLSRKLTRRDKHKLFTRSLTKNLLRKGFIANFFRKSLIKNHTLTKTTWSTWSSGATLGDKHKLFKKKFDQKQHFRSSLF